MKNIFKTLEKRGCFVFSALLYFFLLVWSYLYFINPVFSYMGFATNPNIIKIFEGFLSYIFIIMVSPKRLNKPSDLFFTIILFSLISPLTVFYFLSDASRSTFYVTLLAMACIYVASSGRPIRIPTFKNGSKVADLILWVLLLGTFAILIGNGGLQRMNFDLSKVYEYRQAANNDYYGGVRGYFVNWALKVSGPMLIAMALWKKNFLAVMLLIGFHLFSFGLTSHKIVAFLPLAVIGLWFAFRSNQSLAVVPLGLSVLIIFAMLLSLLLNETTVASLLIRRALYVPSSLIFVYHEFFSHNGFLYWSNSITSGVLNYPYDVNPAKVIGRHMGTGANANAGFIATGYMHAGVVGVVFYATIIGCLFRVIDSLSRKMPSTILPCLFLFSPIVTMVLITDLPTTLLTHGLGFALLIMLLYSSRKVGFGKS